MQKKQKQSSLIRLREGTTSVVDKLKAKDQLTKITVNGHEITMAEYMENPKKYNSAPMSEEYIKQIEKECEENKKTKDLLKCNPSFVDGYKDIN
jgi:hypothetical protein